MSSITSWRARRASTESTAIVPLAPVWSSMMNRSVACGSWRDHREIELLDAPTPDADEGYLRLRRRLTEQARCAWERPRAHTRQRTHTRQRAPRQAQVIFERRFRRPLRFRDGRRRHGIALHGPRRGRARAPLSEHLTNLATMAKLPGTINADHWAAVQSFEPRMVCNAALSSIAEQRPTS
jgi:hypothetical protein